MVARSAVDRAHTHGLLGRCAPRLALVVFAVSLSGCSFLFSKRPPEDYRRGQPLDCSGYALPFIDTVWAGLNAFGAIQAAATDDATWKQKSGYDRSAIVGLGVSWFVISGLSAAHGYRNAAECDEAREEGEAFEESRRRGASAF
jgi:hypothetical protein